MTVEGNQVFVVDYMPRGRRGGSTVRVSNKTGFKNADYVGAVIRLRTD